MGAIWEKNDLRRSSKRGHKTVGGDAGQGDPRRNPTKIHSFLFFYVGDLLFSFAGDFVEVNFPTQKTVGKLWGKNWGKDRV